MSKKKKKGLTPLSTTNFLVGATVCEVNKDSIVVMKDCRIITIGYYAEGSWSDWWEVETKLLISKADLSKNPIITKVEQDGNKMTFVLFGLCRPIAEINATFHNDSDWDYGCTCRIYADGKELACWYGRE